MHEELSPGRWSREQRELLEQMERRPWPARARHVQGSAGLISATLSPIALYSGMQALRSGGSAIDAALSTALTQVTTCLGSLVSYAGVMQLVHYDAASGEISSLDAGWNSYAGEKDPASIPLTDAPVTDSTAAPAAGRKTLVPGFMAGVEAAHQRFGKLPFSALFESAVFYSSHGLMITPMLAGYFARRRAHFERTVEGRKFLRQAGGEVPTGGDMFVQKEVARLLAAVAVDGARVMYTGKWGKAYVETVRGEGGLVTAEDLRRYAPEWEVPLRTTFADVTVSGPGEHNASSGAILEILNLLNAWKIAERGAYWEDASVLATYAQALQLATYGHYSPQVAAFEHDNGFSGLRADRLTPRYADVVAPELGMLSGYGKPRPAGHHSAAVVAIDRLGNVAALVHSGNSMIWGDTGIVVGGVPIPNAASIYQYKLAAVPPGSRLASDMAPVIATRAGKPVLAVATVGSSLVPETVRMVSSAPADAAGLQRILEAPPLLLNFETQEQFLAPRTLLVPEKAYPKSVRDTLSKSGITVKELPTERVTPIKGTAAVLVFDPATRIAQSAEHPTLVVFAEGIVSLPATPDSGVGEMEVVDAELDAQIADDEV